ncbi:ATP-binding cassette domain-containing protein [Aquibacillus sp. 3ASR75-11]|uniref:ATP-binding cassette domain-containing protein n=1 Tax=Terrihalobacillus insolitus TaxID=2950438 RepID=A0A9X3WX30_9BACI|nr:ATP-binding cassette domain-containing protein [Terrihalobacillus insolitus]MDC3414315.1 ATP-binding cassette domain-containing protein [Terrihalobacillus insolitus]MDC3425791.1 ATP-binding cassette domain-containing protein [Terrihalobacillus insolitus]
MTEHDVYLKADHVSKEIKNELILDDINLSLQKGFIYGFRGKNGSGKTMLFRALCGLILSTKGTISIGGITLGKEGSFPPSVGVLIEYPGFLNGYTGFKNLKMLANLNDVIDDNRISESIRLVGLDPNDKRKYRKYSLGMKQRLGIAQAIMEKPELIILDEPTNALDSDGVEEFKKLLLDLKAQNKCILIASHDKEELDYLSDEIFMMENGKIVDHYNL